jgi:hypothetical protein
MTYKRKTLGATIEADAKYAFASMHLDFEEPLRCWLCRRNHADRPAWWGAPFSVVRQHILRNPRLDDRRVVILLCSMCHGLAHGERYGALGELPEFTLANQLWLKWKFDRAWADFPWLAEKFQRALPTRVQPKELFRKLGLAG